MIDWAHVVKQDDILYFDFSRKTTKKNISCLDAAIQTVFFIKEKYPPPYTLCLSGGIDSQAMLWSWYKSGVSFQTFSAKYNFNLNDYDLENLKTFSSLYNITIDYFNFDLLSFLENEHDSWTKKYYCGSPHITTHMKFASMIKEGTPIFSGNFLHRGAPIGPNHAALYRYALIEKKPLVPWFFLETENLAYSFLNNKKRIDSSYIGNYDLKIDRYQTNGFPVIPQKSKFTGFELVKDYIDQNPPRNPSIEDKNIKSAAQSSKRVFDLLYRNKYEHRYNRYYFIKE